jgi:hypothetical protein
MERFLPLVFIVLAACALLFAITFMWASLRALLGADVRQVVGRSDAMRRRSELLDEKEAVLRSLKDLEFERAVGKLGEQDFARLDAEFRLRAKQILRALDDDLREHREKARQLIARETGSHAEAEP